MILETLREILFSPMTIINKAKKRRDINETLEVLVAVWLLFSFSNFFLTVSFGFAPLIQYIITLMIFFIGVLFTIFFSYLLEIILRNFGGRGAYFESLTSFSYGLLPLSLGVFITSLLGSTHYVLGGSLGFLIIALTASIGFSTFFRSLKDMFAVDLTTAAIGFGILMLITLFSIYISLVFSSPSSIPFIQRIFGITY